MLKTRVTGASVRVEFDLYLGGSVRAMPLVSTYVINGRETTLEVPETARPD